MSGTAMSWTTILRSLHDAGTFGDVSDLGSAGSQQAEMPLLAYHEADRG